MEDCPCFMEEKAWAEHEKRLWLVMEEEALYNKSGHQAEKGVGLWRN